MEIEKTNEFRQVKHVVKEGNGVMGPNYHEYEKYVYYTVQQKVFVRLNSQSEWEYKWEDIPVVEINEV